MKPILIALLAGSMTLSAGAVLAQGNGHGNGNGNKGKGNGNVVRVDPVQTTGATGCPPGLAKKNPPCVPPGQAKKYAPGHVVSDYTYIRNPDRYGLSTNGNYVRAGNYVYKVDQNTMEVLNLVGAVADILN